MQLRWMRLGTKEPAVRYSSLSKEQDIGSCGLMPGRPLAVFIGLGSPDLFNHKASLDLPEGLLWGKTLSLREYGVTTHTLVFSLNVRKV